MKINNNIINNKIMRGINTIKYYIADVYEAAN